MKQRAIQILGKVVKGEGYGRKLGFPTANLERRSFSRQKQKIRLGVYAGIAETLHTKYYPLNTKRYKTAVVIGPIDKTGLPKLEAHLIGFKGNLYGKRLILYLHKYLRPFKKFGDESELITQIKNDIKSIKRIQFK